MKTLQIEPYKPRLIEFVEIVNIDNCDIKIYSITNEIQFQSKEIIKGIYKELPLWVNKVANSKLPTYNKAFLIIHEAREGIWVLFNWWTGNEMIQTEVYFANFSEPYKIIESPYSSNSLLCVWELEVFAHERKAWIEHVLLKADNPDFNRYLNDVL